jgi:DNA-binding GntR family transcriptional regulator
VSGTRDRAAPPARGRQGIEPITLIKRAPRAKDADASARAAQPGGSTEKVPYSANPLAEQVYQLLRRDIFSFRLFPGDRFSESEIAQYYGVSRTPMRDALFRMRREGYLEVGFRRGWKVADIDFGRLDQLYDLRIVLELASLDRLASSAPPHRVIDEMKTLWCVATGERENDPGTVFNLDEGFHRGLLGATGNDEMLRVHNEVTERIRIVRRLDFLKPHRTSATYEEHAAILTLLERGKLAEAHIVLRAHITQSKLEVRKITLSMLTAARDSKLPFVN